MAEAWRAIRGLYLITPDGAERERMLGTVAAAVRAGVRVIQYRDKQSTRARRLADAHALRAICQSAGAALIINDDVELCARVRAHGVHLGRDDGTIHAARAMLGASVLIGASCYNDLALAQRARRAGASYVAFGSVWPSPTKPEAVRAPL
ncbi:MAG: thiamine phosphate synthase, partial [Pseudomonadota bacterium]